MPSTKDFGVDLGYLLESYKAFVTDALPTYREWYRSLSEKEHKKYFGDN